MKAYRLPVAFTAINVAILAFNVIQSRPLAADEVAPVLRGKMLEIVDDQGRVRASIKVQAGDPAFKMPDGTVGYPETVMFRLIDAKGRPEVKIGASEKGGGVGLIGANDSTQALLQAEGADSLLKLKNGSGREHLVKP